MEKEDPSTVAAAASGKGLKMEGTYVHETIKNIETVMFDDENEDGDEDDDHDFMHMVNDPFEETVVAINITINRYTSQSSSSAAAPETRSYVLGGFLKDDSPDELDDLLGDKTVTARTLEEIKESILRRRYKIKKIALELRRKKIVVHMKLDLLTWYSDDHKEEDLRGDDHVVGEMVDDDDDDDDYDEEMSETEDDEYDDNVHWKPALRSSVEALETRTFVNEEDLELMLKSTTTSGRSCGICLDEFSIDAAAAAAVAGAGGISIKTMPCSHFFHSECIVPWLEKRNTCPICRYEMPSAF